MHNVSVNLFGMKLHIKYKTLQVKNRTSSYTCSMYTLMSKGGFVEIITLVIQGLIHAAPRKHCNADISNFFEFLPLNLFQYKLFI